MRMPIALFIGLRYLRSKKRSGFASFISLISVVGIALGVLVLITVLSVFNGFNFVIKQQLFSMVPHITLTGYNQKISAWQQIASKIKTVPQVIAVSPFVSGQALMTYASTTTPAMIYGILPAKTNRITHLSSTMIDGHLSALKPGSFNIVLGAGIAAKLGVMVGSKVNVFTPRVSVSPLGVVPRFRQFTVAGVFRSSTGFGFDNVYAYINMDDARHLYALGNQISGLHIDVKNLFQAGFVANKLDKLFSERYQVDDWSEQYGAFYHTIQIQKTMMFLIMLLIIAIAAFNLVSSLVMIVNEKQAEIAILRTLGMTPKNIMLVFVLQGAVIGLIGTVIGAVGGIILSLNITAVVNFIQQLFHVQLLSASVNFVNYLPSKLEFFDIWRVCVIALVMSLVATLYPAYKASKTEVVEALRYE